MAGQFVLCSQLRPESTAKAIRVRLVRTYEVRDKEKSYEIKTIECIFHDQEGTFIHGNISKKQVEQYANKFKEGKVYAIKNFMCITNYFKYKTCVHPLMIKFKQDTLVKEYKRLNFPNLMFRLKSFPSIIMKQDVDEKVLIDIIGRVVQIYSPIQRDIGGRMVRLIDFVLEDASENQLHCTVWEGHVDMMLPYFNSTSIETVVLLLQLCRPRFLDNGEVRISSSFDATKLWFHHKSPQFTNFVKSLPTVCTPIRRIQSQSRLYSVKKETGSSSVEFVVSTIKSVYAMEELGEFWIACKILGVESLEEWYYISCRGSTCYKKVVPINGLLHCKNCGRDWKNGIVRYKVLLRVKDKSMDVPILLWDREAAELVGVSAENLLKKYGVEYEGIPLELLALTNRKMLFKIVMKKQQVYSLQVPFTVIAIDKGSDAIAKFCGDVEGEGVVGDGSSLMGDEGSAMDTDEDFFVGHDVVNLGDDYEDVVEVKEGQLLPGNGGDDFADVPLREESENGSQNAITHSVKRCLLEDFTTVVVPKKQRTLAIKEEDV